MQPAFPMIEIRTLWVGAYQPWDVKLMAVNCSVVVFPSSSRRQRKDFCGSVCDVTSDLNSSVMTCLDSPVW